MAYLCELGECLGLGERSEERRDVADFHTGEEGWGQGVRGGHDVC